MKKWVLFSVIYLITSLIHATPLPAKEVFSASVEYIDPNTFALHWTIKPNYFLYSDRITLNTETDSGVHLGTVRFPKPLEKKDKQGRVYGVYRNQLAIPVAVLGEQAGESLLQLHYQGCADDGFCYPPEVKQIKLTIGPDLLLTAVELTDNDDDAIAAPEPSTTASEPDQIAEIFSQHNWAMILLSFFGIGLLLSFTPCILPMVPVLSGIVVGHGKEVTTRKAFLLSLSYVLSMSVTYAVVGALVALLGENLQLSMQSPAVISVFSLLFVLLALSMFGFYEFKLPDAWQAKIAGSSRSQRGGHYLGAAIMGCLSTLILSPCVTAPLIGVLSYIAQSQNVLLGSLTLFFLSLGMGTPLLLIGTSAGKWLPSTGSWMNAVKGFFGVMLIAVAIYLMARIIPASITLMLWACLFIFSGIYSGALTYSQTNKEKFCQGIGLILLGYGALMLIGASMGATNLLQPLALTHTAKSEPPAFTSTSAQTLATVEQAIAENNGMPIMLDFYADWCASCKVMEAMVFTDPKIAAALSQFKVIKIDVTKNNTDDKELMKHFSVVAPPTFIFFDKRGKQLPRQQLVGEQSAVAFAATLDNVAASN
ncbi:MAG: protein-disulfide reductase DsbD [Legionella sp.]